MALGSKSILRFLFIWFSANFCMIAPVKAENSVTWFVRMQHVVVPLRTKTKPKVKVDALARTVHLSFDRLRASEVRHLRAQIRTGGGKVLWARNKSSKTEVLLGFSFNNMLVLHSVESKPRRFVMDVGTCRYLLPEAPWSDFSSQVDDRPSQKILQFSERQLALGTPQKSVSRLEKLATSSSDKGLLACMRLADIAMLERQAVKAGLMAETCLHRCRALNSKLEPLAMLRMISYRDRLFSKQLLLQLADLEPEPGSTDWVTQEYYYQLARVHFARGEYEKSLARAVMLSISFKGSRRASDVSPLALAAMERIAKQGKRAGKFASVAGALLDGVRWIHPIAPVRFVRLVRTTADALLKAGAPRMAADLLTWYLRSMAGKKVDDGVLKLLCRAFLKVGDSYRAGRTLDFLVAQDSRKSYRSDVLELKAKILFAEGRKQDAIDTLAAALQVAADPELIKRVAYKTGCLLHDSNAQRGLDIVTGALSKLSKVKKDHGFSELLLLQADLAYSLGKKEIASPAYESFIRLNPRDDRRQMALYRLQRMGKSIIGLMDPEDLNDTSVWSQAGDVFRQSESLLGGRP